MINVKIKDIVKNNNMAEFLYLRDGLAYYQVNCDIDADTKSIIFPIQISDLGNATLFATETALLLMRYIRIAKTTDNLILVTDKCKNK